MTSQKHYSYICCTCKELIWDMGSITIVLPHSVLDSECWICQSGHTHHVWWCLINDDPKCHPTHYLGYCWFIKRAGCCIATSTTHFFSPMGTFRHVYKNNINKHYCISAFIKEMQHKVFHIKIGRYTYNWHFSKLQWRSFETYSSTTHQVLHSICEHVVLLAFIRE